MKGDIALAGFVMTAEEWQALDPVHRSQLLAAANRPREADAWVVAPVTGLLGSESHKLPDPVDDER